MSTVIGLKTKNGIWLGADSRASTEDGEIRPVVTEKIIVNGPYLIGFIGSVRGGQIIRKEYFTTPKNPFDWPDALIEQCQKKNCMTSGDPQPAIMLCNYIIADSRSSKLYEILIDFQMNEIEEMTAIGSGSPYAFGSLFSTKELNINEKRRVELALQTAEFFDAATGGALIVKKLRCSK